MKNPVAKLLFAFAAMLVVIAAVLYLTREPSFGGRTLSKWLRVVWDAKSTPEDRMAATNAVRAIGTKAIPVLVRKVSAQDPRWKKWLQRSDVHTMLSDQWLFASQQQRADGMAGFSTLGTQAMHALPELANILLDPAGNTAAGYALGSIGPAAFPVLRQALTNANPAVRQAALFGIMANADNAHACMEDIRALRFDTNVVVLSALIWIEQVLPKDEACRMAVLYLDNPDYEVQVMALRTIRRTATNLTQFLPRVLPLLQSTNPSVSIPAGGAIYAVDPARAAELGIKTNLYFPNGTPR